MFLQSVLIRLTYANVGTVQAATYKPSGRAVRRDTSGRTSRATFFSTRPDGRRPTFRIVHHESFAHQLLLGQKVKVTGL